MCEVHYYPPVVTTPTRPVVPANSWLKSGSVEKLVTSIKYNWLKTDRKETLAAAWSLAQVAAAVDVLGTIHDRVSQVPPDVYRLKALLN
jgi:hypothetical protein